MHYRNFFSLKTGWCSMSRWLNVGISRTKRESIPFSVALDPGDCSAVIKRHIYHQLPLQAPKFGGNDRSVTASLPPASNGGNDFSLLLFSSEKNGSKNTLYKDFYKTTKLFSKYIWNTKVDLKLKKFVN